MSHDPAQIVAPQIGALSRSGSKLQRNEGTPKVSFTDSLDRETARGLLKFTAHATRRLAARNITLSAEGLARLERATQLAAGRGSRDALLMMGNLGLIVNVKNRAVLTALDLKRTSDRIVTNIDSTVVVQK